MTLRWPTIWLQGISGCRLRVRAETRLAAPPPSPSSVRSSARRVLPSASSFASVKPSMRAIVSRAVSSISHRCAASLSSGFIEQLEVGQYGSAAMGVPEHVRRDNVDRAIAECGGEILLHLRDVPQRHLALRLELHQQIAAAPRPNP